MFTVMHLQCNSMGQDSRQISSDLKKKKFSISAVQSIKLS